MTLEEFAKFVRANREGIGFVVVSKSTPQQLGITSAPMADGFMLGLIAGLTMCSEIAEGMTPDPGNMVEDLEKATRTVRSHLARMQQAEAN